MKKVIVYSTPTCPYCVVAKNFLKEHSIEFEAKDVAIDEKAREEMIKKTGQMGVPVIDIDGEIIINFDEGRIRKLLDIK
ncbi:NrdH-redoxin [bacterium]|nr:MAG: NrdH-redoxin [bacterium]